MMRALHSEPERFVLNVLPGGREASRLCTFALPSGRWERGRWDVAGRVPSGTPFLCKSAGKDTLCEVEGEADRERYTVSGPVGGGTLAEINAAAGRPFAVEMIDLFAEKQPEGAMDAVVSFTLTLVGMEIVGEQGVMGTRVTCIYDAELFPPRQPRRQHTGVADADVGRCVTFTYEPDGRRRE
jgi:hypothetical protein